MNAEHMAKNIVAAIPQPPSHWAQTGVLQAYDLAVALLVAIEALEFYGKEANWDDQIKVWGYGQGQHAAIVAAAKEARGSLAREALAIIRSEGG